MLIHDLLAASARARPGKAALRCEGVEVTYAGLEKATDKVARFLTSAGFRRGDRAAVFLDNGIAAVVAVYGILKAGGAFIMVNPTTKPAKLDYLLADSKASVVFTSHENASLLTPFAEKGNRGLSLVIVAGTGASANRATGASEMESILAGPVEAFSGPRLIDVDLAALIYTSGSTGRPKAAVLTHRNMVCAIDSITGYLGNRDDDVILSVLPLSFDYGLYQVLMSVAFGGTVILERSFNYPSSILNALKNGKATGFPAVPTIFMVLSRLDGFTQENIPTLRYFTNTGAALPVPVIREVRRRFPDVRFFSMYGLTECKRVSFLPPDQIDRIPESVGKAMPNLEAWVAREDGSTAAAGEVGELAVRGSTVMGGYWNDPEATARILKPGRHPWERVLMTGDLFRADVDGYLYFVGRKDDIIKCRGEKVSPREVETVLYAMAGVIEAAVVGVDDPLLGTMVTAHLAMETDNGVTENDVLRHCAAQLENFMVPGKVVFHRSLPKTASGKIDKLALKQASIAGRLG